MELYIIENWMEKVDQNKERSTWSLSILHKLFPELTIQKDARGKPFVTNTPLFINWAHNEQYLVVATSQRGEIGVDIESKHIPYEEALYGWILHEEEKKKLNDGIIFSEIWTRKEALLKCTGEGIHEKMACINSYDTKRYAIESFPYKDCILSVCTQHVEKITYFRHR